MFGSLRKPGQSFAIEKDGTGKAQIKTLRQVAHHMGLLNKAAFSVEEQAAGIEVTLISLAAGGYARAGRRGPLPITRAWHGLAVGASVEINASDVKNSGSLRTAVSKWAIKNDQHLSVTVLRHPPAYRIHRTA